jgi:hypothetical protein
MEIPSDVQCNVYQALCQSLTQNESVRVNSVRVSSLEDLYHQGVDAVSHLTLVYKYKPTVIQLTLNDEPFFETTLDNFEQNHPFTISEPLLLMCGPVGIHPLPVSIEADVVMYRPLVHLRLKSVSHVLAFFHYDPQTKSITFLK